jgi:hypothetical protein
MNLKFSKSILIFTLLFTILSCKKHDEKVEEVQSDEFLKDFDRIRLISYNTKREVYNSNYELKIENDTIKIPNINFIDNVVLKKNESDKIFDILLTFPEKCTLADCYNPRHILLFYKKNKMVEYFEFCAECGGSQSSSKRIKINSICSEQGKQLIKVFKEMKLKNDGEESDTYKYF